MLELDVLLRFAAALAAVLALIVGAAWLARRYAAGGRLSGLGGKRRLAIVEAVAVDNRTRLVLLRRDETEHLVLLGPGGGVVVEASIRPAGGFARAAEAARADF